MTDRGDPVGLLRPDVVNEEHERRDPGIDEPVGRLLFKHDGGDRTEVFSVLDVVEPGLHLRVDWRGEDGPRPQRARSKFHPALEPADDLVPYQQGRDLGGDIGHPPVGKLGPAEKCLDLVITVRRAQKRMIHAVGPVVSATLSGIDPERRTQGCACITGGRLHPDAPERSPIAQPGVHHAVQCHATGHAQVPAAGRYVEPSRQVQYRLFQDNLKRVRDVEMTLVDGTTALACRSEALLQTRRLDRVLPALSDLDNLTKSGKERGLAVGGQRHHLVFIGRVEEPEIARDLLVEDPQRVRHIHLTQPGNLVAVAQAVGRGGLLTPAVESQDGGVVER